MPSVKIIILSQGKLALVDEADYDYLIKYKWSAVRNHNNWYAMRTDVTNGRKTVYMHREIMKPSEDLLVDHKDGDGLNNQRYNLQVCTTVTNNANNCSKGVSFFAGGWYARLQVNGVRRSLGRYKTEEEALQVYQKRKDEICQAQRT